MHFGILVERAQLSGWKCVLSARVGHLKMARCYINLLVKIPHFESTRTKSGGLYKRHAFLIQLCVSQAQASSAWQEWRLIAEDGLLFLWFEMWLARKRVQLDTHGSKGVDDPFRVALFSGVVALHELTNKGGECVSHDALADGLHQAHLESKVVHGDQMTADGVLGHDGVQEGAGVLLARCAVTLRLDRRLVVSILLLFEREGPAKGQSIAESLPQKV